MIIDFQIDVDLGTVVELADGLVVALAAVALCIRPLLSTVNGRGTGEAGKDGCPSIRRCRSSPRVYVTTKCKAG